MKKSLKKVIGLVVISACLAAPATYAGGKYYKQKQNIVQTAASNASFTTLVAAIQAADLVDMLQSNGPFTVFAPTNEAFEKLPKGTLDALLKPENKDKLVEILTYHVVPGKVFAKDVVKLDEAATVQGQRVSINADGHCVTIDQANVVQTDIKTKNGVIHVIDSVILPKG